MSQLFGSGVGIKSIQRGTIVLSGAGADGVVETNTATITSVDMNNAFVRFLGSSGANTSYGNFCRVELTNATTVTASHFNHLSTTVSYEVIEFYPGVIKSIQRGTIAIANGGVLTNTATITSVTTTQACIEDSGIEPTTDAGATTYQEEYVYTLVLTNATTVTATRGLGTAAAVKIGFTVVEFY